MAVAPKGVGGRATALVVATGGTIAQARDPATGVLFPAISGEELVAAVPQLASHAELRVLTLCTLDSSQMTPLIWADLARTLDRELADPEITGAVVTHGTDTLAEAAYFLDLTLRSRKPVALVGAMRSPSDPSTDGPQNLLDGIVQVTSPESVDWGVTLTMNQRIHSPRHVRKTATLNVQTFDGGDKGCLGWIAQGRVFRLNRRLIRVKLPLPDDLPRVDLVAEHAGADGSLIRAARDRGARGIVVEALGSGNVGLATYGEIADAIADGAVVVVTSRVYWGPVLPEYGAPGGGASLVEAGAIMAADLTAPKACIHLMLALANVGPDRERIRASFERTDAGPDAESPDAESPDAES